MYARDTPTMSPFFPQRNMTSQTQTPPSLGARTQHRIDSGVSMPRPKYERYQYYSQNSLKERKRILAKSERELAQKLDVSLHLLKHNVHCVDIDDFIENRLRQYRLPAKYASIPWFADGAGAARILEHAADV